LPDNSALSFGVVTANWHFISDAVLKDNNKAVTVLTELVFNHISQQGKQQDIFS